jgi:hypothetical protein
MDVDEFRMYLTYLSNKKMKNHLIFIKINIIILI